MIELPTAEPIAAYKDLTDEQWHELRKTGVGGSDAGAILGYSQYATPLSVWMQKTGRMQPQDAGELAEMGTLLEPFIRRELVAPYIEEKIGTEVKVHDPTHMYRSTLYPIQIINTDGFLTCDDWLAGLEIKTGTSYQLQHWGGVDGDLVPDVYYCQVQHYLSGTGLQEWWVFGVIGNRRLLRIVPRNEEFITGMIEAEKSFWEKVLSNRIEDAPMPLGKDADLDAIMELGTPQQETTVDLSDVENLIDRYEQLRIELQDKKEERETIGQRIKLLLDKNKYGETDNYQVTFSRFERTNIDTQALRKDYPAIVDSYTKKSESGRLSVKGKA